VIPPATFQASRVGGLSSVAATGEEDRTTAAVTTTAAPPLNTQRSATRKFARLVNATAATFAGSAPKPRSSTQTAVRSRLLAIDVTPAVASYLARRPGKP
jgi:hypothetical protein